VPAAHKLIVQTKDADNNLHPLQNPEQKLEGVLKPDKEGKYRVYVEVPEKEVKGLVLLVLRSLSCDHEE